MGLEELRRARDPPAAGHRHAIIGRGDPHRHLAGGLVAVGPQFLCDPRIPPLADPRRLLGPLLHLGRVGDVDGELDRMREGRDARLRVDRDLADRQRMRCVGPGLDPDRLDRLAARLGLRRPVPELRQVAESLAILRRLERPRVEPVGAVGLAGPDGDRLDNHWRVEDEREGILVSGLVLRGEEGRVVAVEGELADLARRRGQRRLDDGLDRLRLRIVGEGRGADEQDREDRAVHGSSFSRVGGIDDAGLEDSPAEPAEKRAETGGPSGPPARGEAPLTFAAGPRGVCSVRRCDSPAERGDDSPGPAPLRPPPQGGSGDFGECPSGPLPPCGGGLGWGVSRA